MTAGEERESQGGGGKAVPGTDQLAVIAPINAIADEGAQRFRYRSIVLDGQVGDATACIQLVRGKDCLGGADVQAGATGTAVIGSRWIGFQGEVAE